MKHYKKTTPESPSPHETIKVAELIELNCFHFFDNNFVWPHYRSTSLFVDIISKGKYTSVPHCLLPHYYCSKSQSNFFSLPRLTRKAFTIYKIMTMTMNMIPMCKQTQTLLNVPLSTAGGHNHKPRRQKDKVVIVMGATGTGKSKLSIDLATRFPAEIINSDKMQVYEGLDIATNKITREEQRGVPHHLLGSVDPNEDFTANDFCKDTCDAVESILGRDRLPIIVGGSNSYLETLIDEYDYNFRSRYDCCFLWVNVSVPVLHSFVSDRVDQMVEKGMVEEVRDFFDPNADYTRGIRRAIGVPEFDSFFRYGPVLDEETRAGLLEEAINQVKYNNCKLACRQLDKIRRFRNKGWNLHPLEATEVFRKRGKEANQAWERLVSGPSAVIVRQFLYNVKPEVPTNLAANRELETAALATR